MLFAELLSLHLVTFLMFFILVVTKCTPSVAPSLPCKFSDMPFVVWFPCIFVHWSGLLDWITGLTQTAM